MLFSGGRFGGAWSLTILFTASAACSLDTERFSFDGSLGGGGTGAGTGADGGSGPGGGGTGDGGAGMCMSDEECTDDVECNGVETCTSGTCSPGAALADGTQCTPPARGGDQEYVCVESECVATCETEEDCDDASVCTGAETCSPVTNTCVAGVPLMCDDANACTSDDCDPSEGCQFSLIDVDMDGYASETLGACGSDCNDNDNEVYPLAPELCDGKDNNCNRTTDEGTPIWYPDCDSDGFAAAGAVGVQSCDQPVTAPGACNASAPAPSWTATAPGAGTTDCWDLDDRAHPFIASQNALAWKASAIVGAPTTVDFDFNCDRVEEKRWTAAGQSSSSVCIDGGISCTGGGWYGTSPPECGESRSYVTCNLYQPGNNCVKGTVTRIQECR